MSLKLKASRVRSLYDELGKRIMNLDHRVTISELFQLSHQVKASKKRKLLMTLVRLDCDFHAVPLAVF